MARQMKTATEQKRTSKDKQTTEDKASISRLSNLNWRWLEGSSIVKQLIVQQQQSNTEHTEFAYQQPALQQENNKGKSSEDKGGKGKSKGKSKSKERRRK